MRLDVLFFLLMRMEKEIKRLKIGWSDSSEDVTDLKILLKDRIKKLEDLKMKEE